MILFRALAGISAAFVTPQVWAAIPALVPPQNIMKAMGNCHSRFTAICFALSLLLWASSGVLRSVAAKENAA
ncbi:hypothetical protein [Brevibacillus borstelensis]|uniref:hypothetical protein n=1 Tax=Brevibacillus borstelensis TaxID=45462 RepID=UPI001FA94504|nr:hypothetical protein [Brevibacillus borstelensis]